MNLVRINNLNKTFGGNVLFNNLSMEINSDEKIALIGRNGVGKSTLVRIILNEITPDSGEIFIFRQAKIGYLSQKIIESEESTLIEECLKVFEDIIKIEKQLKNLAENLKSDHSEQALNRYSDKEHEYMIKGGYEYQTKINMLLSRFGFDRTEYDRQINTFSGGEKTRIAFAKLLMIEPDLLLLDEPTNHMDIEIIEWLEEYLKRYKGAVLVITHDKYFINKVVNKIYDMDNQSVELYHGNYDFYEEEKVRRYELILKKSDRQKKEIAHLQSFVDRFRYKAKKAKSAQDRIKKIDRIKRIEVPKQSKSHLNLNFSTKRPTNVHVLEVENLSIGYDLPLIEDINFKIRGFEKVGIIGNNGTGKTTLIKTILGDIAPLNGTYRFYKQMKIGYFEQNLQGLNKELNLIETIHNVYPQKTLHEVRTLLAKVEFTGDEVFKKVKVLSGGELVKLNILMLMLEKPEILILDEPTNHLDIDSKNVVEDIFEEYDGPIIFISHDRYFINKVATKIIKLDTEALVYNGNYEEYLLNIRSNKVNDINKENKKIKSNDLGKDLLKIEQMIEAKEKEFKAIKSSLFDEEVYSNIEKYNEVAAMAREIERELEDLLIKYEEIEKTV